MSGYENWREHTRTKGTQIVSAMHRCQTSDAKYLCIFETGYKLSTQGEYDIGGTYTVNDPDIWFYFSTGFCPGSKYLVNLFVCLRKKTKSFDIGVSNSSDMERYTDDNNDHRVRLSSELKWQLFRPTADNDRFFVKTYCIPQDNLNNLTLCIPISIVTPGSLVNMDFLRQLKLNHDFGQLLSKQETTNFALQSCSGKKYQVHRLILAAHSPVLREIVKSDSVTVHFLNINDNDMELLLEFLYSGTIKDITKKDCLNILNIASKFKLDNLFRLVQYAIAERIDVANCIETGLISEKYSLTALQTSVFKFIKENPLVLETDGWKTLDNVNFAKKLVTYLHQ